MMKRAWVGAVCLLAAMAAGGRVARAQGCVAAHSNQRSMDVLVLSDKGGEVSPKWIHNLTVNIGYRVFNSNKYFVGSTEIARPRAVENHQNIFDVDLEYQLTHRWSIIADIPVFDGTRNQIYPPVGIFQVSGLGDITVGAQAWVFRPPTESGGNVAVNTQLKMPTGINDATGSALYHGQTVKATADQSLQPGDGTWGRRATSSCGAAQHCMSRRIICSARRIRTGCRRSAASLGSR